MVVDIVPNHLGIAEPAENPAFWDVLRLGQDSPYAPWFDIDWQANPQGRLLLPVLGDDATLERRRTASCATTTTASRSLRAPGAPVTTPTRCTPASTTSWRTGAARTPS